MLFNQLLFASTIGVYDIWCPIARYVYAIFALFLVLSLRCAHTQLSSLNLLSTFTASHMRTNTRLFAPAQLQCSRSGVWEPGNEAIQWLLPQHVRKLSHCLSSFCGKWDWPFQDGHRLRSSHRSIARSKGSRCPIWRWIDRYHWLHVSHMPFYYWLPYMYMTYCV